MSKEARHALEAQERQYTFGNDEFNLEAAYHDCKMVFDGITDDDSFQEADTGLILYYANEIIYALHEALEGKDTNVLSDDCISRQAAIDKLDPLFESLAIDKIKALPSAQPELIEQSAYVRGFEQGRTQGMIDAQGGEEMNKQRKVVITVTYNEMGMIIDTKAEELGSSAQPERKTGKWIRVIDGFECSNCECLVEEEREPLYDFCPSCGADMRGDEGER